ncbi:MAG: histidine phosphatase family protein [Sedimentitalea sp.]
MHCPEFLVLRHGETEWNRMGRMQGALDSPLTPKGRQQAARQGDILRRFGTADWSFLSSPQGRARATAEIALGPDAGIIEDARLAEITVGDWTGIARDTLMAQHPHLFENGDLGWYDHAPGGEGLAGLAMRCESFLKQLQGPSVIVTHGITSRVLRCFAQGLPYDAFETLNGGQGVVYHLKDGVSTLLE